MKIPRMTMNLARIVAGGGIFVLTVLVFVMMWLRPELAENDLFKSLAQAIVIQGLIGLAMAFLFTGRNAAEPDEAPQKVEVVNNKTKPVPTTEEQDDGTEDAG